MTNSPTPQSADLPSGGSTNPYVGPRTFSHEQRHLFFGREREARDLLARVLSERLLLFYAQSGAGKSSLLHTRLIPQLQEEKGFVVLPVGRVSGELPAGVEQVDDIFTFNLLLSIDEGNNPGRLAHVTLSDFLARLARRTVTDATGRQHKGWVFDASLSPEPAAAGPNARRYALIIDQFEEIITSHPDRWREREDFFRQLDAAMRGDPNLWVVLTLREDYVASLDPYAPLVADRLRARFYMERMGVDAALDAIRRPAAMAGRPFAEGVTEQLVDNLRQVRVPGQRETIPGQYVEPVQLQVVCYQLWENIKRRPAGLITATDLREAGDVDRALTQFYEETLVAALADPAAAGVSERHLRTWFDQQLITGAGTRGLVHQGETETGGLPNDVVRALQQRFLVRGEARGGDTWIELVHDRLVEPVQNSNATWLEGHLSAFQVQAALWQKSGRKSSLLLKGEALAAAEAEAEEWKRDHAGQELPAVDEAFLKQCRKEAAGDLMKSAKRWQRISKLAIGQTVGFLLGFILTILGTASSSETSNFGLTLTCVGGGLILLAMVFSFLVILSAISLGFRPAQSEGPKRAFQVQAALWKQSGRPSSLLLRGEALAAAEAEAEEWKMDHAGQKLPAVDEAFLRQCRKEAASNMLKSSREWLRVQRLAVGARIGFVLGLLLLIVSFTSSSLFFGLAYWGGGLIIISLIASVLVVILRMGLKSRSARTGRNETSS